jgi:hypothetical protein
LYSKSVKAGLLLWLSTSFSHFGQIEAATIKAKSVSLVDVRSAVASAKDGDTVVVPAGTATWTSTLGITKNITLQGAGAEATIIADDVPQARGKGARDSSKIPRISTNQSVRKEPRRKTNPAKRENKPGGVGSQRAPLISITLHRDLPFRMTGFTFKGGNVNTQRTFNGEIRISGVSHSFRIDHCTFDKLHGTNLVTHGFLWGVIDHCRFNLTNEQPININHETWNKGDWGNGSWADDPYWGSEKFIFIEDNVFENSGRKRAIDAFEGARFVVRYNQFHNCVLAMHGTEGQGRGGKQVEEYNNTYRSDYPGYAEQIRSGSIITHDNKWGNIPKGHVLQCYRQFHRCPHWGVSNGQNPYDDNAPNGSTGYWETGKHTGANGATELTDSTKNWAPNQWHVPGVTYIVRNITKEAAGDSHLSFAIANTANTITCSSLTFEDHIRLTFNTGDTYQIWKVVHSLDQPGLGKGDLLRGLPGRPAKWPRQTTEPCYSWNNTALEDGTPRNLSSTEPSIKEGRDFFNETPKPGYTPYTYPHPLVSSWPPSDSHQEARGSKSVP